MTQSVNASAMQSMLMEMKAMQNVAQKTNANAPMRNADESFGQMLTQAMMTANQSQVHAEQMQTAYELGDKKADLISVMLATQKANVSFQTLMQVRNRLLNAYREVMNMPM